MTKGKKRPPPQSDDLVAIFLAAGYGTRLRRDFVHDPAFAHLVDIPKPLIPLGGLPLIAHWFPMLASLPGLRAIVIITNGNHFSKYNELKENLRTNPAYGGLDLPTVTVLSDSSYSNETRCGAVHDLHIALSHIERNFSDIDNALVIAADTLLPSTDLLPHLQALQRSEHEAAVFSYKLTDMSDSVRRGMLAVTEVPGNKLIATRLVEKPATIDLAPSSWATAPVYFFRRPVWPDIALFLSERANEPIEKKDAPGLLLAWVIPRFSTLVLPVLDRIDIGRLQHYKTALYRYITPPLPIPYSREAKEPAVGRANPRIGLLGNPSDQYNGKVLAVSIASEGYAEVVASPSDEFRIQTNSSLELPTRFEHLADFISTLQTHGLRFGAKQLVSAATLVFARKYTAAVHPNDNMIDALSALPSCNLTYETSIPARIGLAGSSALILATWRALARFYNTSLEQIDPDQASWPVLLRSTETDELGITCGLMDRVVQVMQGCVSMDFTSGLPGVWTRVPERALPELYVCYYADDTVGECSGKIHSRGRHLHSVNDPVVRDIVDKLINLVDRGCELLKSAAHASDSNMRDFTELFDKNFELRCALLGRAVVGDRNLQLIDLVRRAGFAGKMTGSGGCAVCVPRPVRRLTEDEESDAKCTLEAEGIILRRVEILEALQWRSRRSGDVNEAAVDSGQEDE